MGSILAISEAITALVPVFWKLFNLYKEARQKGWIKEGNGLIKQVQGAKTDEERLALARDLFNHRAK